MKSVSKALGIEALVLALSCCGNNQSVNQPNNNRYQTIKGIPISVVGNYDFHGGYVAVVLEVEGKHVLAYGLNVNDGKGNAEAIALIQSEISDGDKEPIELTGDYYKNEFIIQTVNANEYRVDF